MLEPRKGQWVWNRLSGQQARPRVLELMERWDTALRHRVEFSLVLCEARSFTGWPLWVPYMLGYSMTLWLYDIRKQHPALLPKSLFFFCLLVALRQAEQELIQTLQAVWKSCGMFRLWNNTQFDSISAIMHMALVRRDSTQKTMFY